MIFWLDNQENTNEVHNENYGRELLELFSMGIGNYTEDDVKELRPGLHRLDLQEPDPDRPSRTAASTWEFEFRPELHDYGEKTFLGETRQLRRRGHHRHHRAAARHGAVHRPAALPLLRLRPAGPGGDRRAGRGLRALRLRDPADAAGAVPVRLLPLRGAPTTRWSRARPTTWSGCCGWPRTSASRSPGIYDVAFECRYMGQDLLNPPSVEGWHTGKEWIDTGILVERVNFAAERRRRSRASRASARSSTGCGRPASCRPRRSSTPAWTCSARCRCARRRGPRCSTTSSKQGPLRFGAGDDAAADRAGHRAAPADRRGARVPVHVGCRCDEGASDDGIRQQPGALLALHRLLRRGRAGLQ